MISYETLLHNPTVQTALLGLIGALAYWAREVPGLVLGWAKRFFISSMTLDSREPFLFPALIEHMHGYAGLNDTNQFTAHSSRHGDPYQSLAEDLRAGFLPDAYLSPAEGLHIFRADGRWLWLRRDIQTAQTVLERITLSTFGRNPDFLRRFLHDAVAARIARETSLLAVYVPNPFSGGEWMRARLGGKRALSSVVLRAGVGEALAADLSHFFSSHTRYQTLGIPWRRGYLLYGPPGTGKTSLVTALASELQLNVCTFSLASPIVTDDKIHSLLASLPQRSLLLIEDVDAFFNQRETAHDEVRLSFSGFLNALDGVATQEGSVLFMTTNHVDRLDPALIRAGRIDVKVKLDHCDADQLRRLFLKFHPDEQAADAFVAAHRNKNLAPAVVQDMLMRRYVNPAATGSVAVKAIGDPDAALS